MLDAVPRLPQEEDLGTQLDELGLPQRLVVRPRAATLVFDRDDGRVARLEQVDLGDQAELL